jgi:hypothetical protein
VYDLRRLVAAVCPREKERDIDSKRGERLVRVGRLANLEIWGLLLGLCSFFFGDFFGLSEMYVICSPVIWCVTLCCRVILKASQRPHSHSCVLYHFLHTPSMEDSPCHHDDPLESKLRQAPATVPPHHQSLAEHHHTCCTHKIPQIHPPRKKKRKKEATNPNKTPNTNNKINPTEITNPQNSNNKNSHKITSTANHNTKSTNQTTTKTNDDEREREREYVFYMWHIYTILCGNKSSLSLL